jgi:putative ABC transport system ATP-binding protein
VRKAEVLLRIENVRKSYDRPGGRRIALDGVSLELDRGQVIGIFGPSGSGKTTLLRIIAGLQTPDDGTVTYRGEALSDMSAVERIRYRRREIACVWASQTHQERLDVLDYVALPLLVDRRGHRRAVRQAREALVACEVDAAIGMELHELSDGERQRVAIAHALVREPRLLIADGPTSSLSLAEQEQVMVLLASLAYEAKVAVLITDTDAQALLRTDPLLYLCDGRLVNGKPMSELGQLLRFPSARSRGAAANA